jgi:molecular chaperone HscC
VSRCWLPHSDMIVGIDLGTTHSLVAHFHEGQPVVMENELGESLTASAVAVAEDGTLLVGRAARDRLIMAPQAGQAFFKRDMGTATTYRFGGRAWTPIELSATILREMKRIAEWRLGCPVDRAVITVPAYFLDQQRQATMEAAQIAGLKVERLLNEPTAAALAYGYANDEELNTLLVFDLGGGTFDVTVLESFDGIAEVKASAGESRLGGEDYTEQLMAWLCKKHQWQPAMVERQRFRLQVEMLKRSLTDSPSASLLMGPHRVEVTRKDFGEATWDLTQRLRPVLRRALRESGLTKRQLDAVLLVGGASRMPIIHAVLLDELDQAPRQDLDPDRVVAAGAAVQAALCGRNAAVRDLVLTDVCPHSLGVEVSKMLGKEAQAGYFSPIIDRNTTVPVSRSERFHTLHEDQDEILIKIYQGESRMTQENHCIGQVRATGLKYEPGQTKPGIVDVRFSYDMNGILEVEVTILHSGNKVSAVFEQRPGSLTKVEIAEAIARLHPLKTHPRDMPAHRARLERANRLWADMRGNERDTLSLVIDSFERALATQDNARIREASEDLDSFLKPYFMDE